MRFKLFLGDEVGLFQFDGIYRSPRVEVMTKSDLRNEGILSDPNILYVKGSGTVKLDLNDSEQKEQVNNLATVRGTVLMSFKHIGNNLFQVLVHHVYFGSLVEADESSRSGLQKMARFIPFSDSVTEKVTKTLISKFNEKAKENPINLIYSLDLAEKGKDTVKILPSEIFGLGVKFQSITPLSKDLLSIELEYK